MTREREHDKIAKKVAAECRAAGRVEVDLDALPLGGATGLGTLLFGGTMTPDTLQIYRVTGADERVDHFLQPIAGGTALPVLHVARIAQPIRASAILRRGILFERWRSPDADVATWLSRRRRPRDLSWSGSAAISNGPSRRARSARRGR